MNKKNHETINKILDLFYAVCQCFLQI